MALALQRLVVCVPRNSKSGHQLIQKIGWHLEFEFRVTHVVALILCWYRRSASELLWAPLALRQQQADRTIPPPQTFTDLAGLTHPIPGAEPGLSFSRAHSRHTQPTD